MPSVLIQVNGDDLSLTNVPFSDGRPSWLVSLPFAITGNVNEVGGVNFGTAVQNLPLTFPLTTSTGFLTTSYSDIFYNRIIIEPPLLNLGSVSAQQTRTIRVFNAFFNTVTLLDIVNNNLAGLSISGSLLPVIFNQLQEIEYTITAGTEGPANIDGNFTFDFANPIADIAYQISGTRIVLWPYLLRPGLVEQVQFLTQIITSNNGTEQRIRNRKAPRHNFNFTSEIPREELRRAENLLYGWRARIWALPLWGEARRITDPVALDSQTISVNTQFGNFLTGGLAVIWENARKFDLFEILSFTDSQITLDRGVVDDFTINAFVVPVRTGFMRTNPSRITNGHESDISSSIQINQNNRIDSVASQQQYKNLDVFLQQPLYTGNGASEQYRERVDIVDFNIGLTLTHTPWTYLKNTRNLLYVLEGQQEIWEFRQFLNTRGGAQVPFYMPSFENNIEIVSTGTILEQIDIANDEYGLQGFDRTNIALFTRSGNWLFREVTNITTISSTLERLTLDSALSIDSTEIISVSYMGLKRLMDDGISIEWLANNVARVNLTIQEIEP